MTPCQYLQTFSPIGKVQYENFCFARSKNREIQNITRNVKSMLNLKSEIELEMEEVQRQDSTTTKYRN